MLESGRPTAMLTDLYQITMAQAYHDAGIAQVEGCFHLYFRDNPFGGGFTVAAGLQQVIEWLQEWRFAPADIDYLDRQRGVDGQPLFSEAFLAELSEWRFTADVDAVPEGTVVFAREPLLRITGPLPMCQLVETALLNMINFQTLVATKAARCVLAAGDSPIAEFGLRRAQGPDGGISASRAAYIGGCASTSNVAAAIAHGIPASGTHAHSWVMAFDSEKDAFDAYAKSLPNNVILLVDTYDVVEGVRNAVLTGKALRERGHEMIGVRIDSGDLAELSKAARKILDEGGFPDASVVVSNELDEYLITSLREQGAPIDAYGVGTKLVTAWDQPALGGVYKLSAIREPGGSWVPRIKVSEATAKVTTPGVLGVRRYVDGDGALLGDMVYDVHRAPQGDAVMVDPEDATHVKAFSGEEAHSELLQPVFRRGELVYRVPPLDDVRERAAAQIRALDPAISRLVNPNTNAVGLERSVFDQRMRLVLEARGIASDALG